MIEPGVHLAYAPQGAGLLCATFWFERDGNVYGWFTGARAYELVAAFFMLENYQSRRRTVYYRSAESDVYGDWLQVSDGGEVTLDPPCPVPDPVCHALEHQQDAFLHEWLVYRDDPEHQREIAQLQARELPVLAVNVKPSKITKLNTDAVVWTYTSPGADLNIPAFLATCWPLDYTVG